MLYSRFCNLPAVLTLEGPNTCCTLASSNCLVQASNNHGKVMIHIESLLPTPQRGPKESCETSSFVFACSHVRNPDDAFDDHGRMIGHVFLTCPLQAGGGHSCVAW